VAQNIVKQRLQKNGSIIEGSETVAGNTLLLLSSTNIIIMTSSHSTVIGANSDNKTELQEKVEVMLTH